MAESSCRNPSDNRYEGYKHHYLSECGGSQKGPSQIPQGGSRKHERAQSIWDANAQSDYGGKGHDWRNTRNKWGKVYRDSNWLGTDRYQQKEKCILGKASLTNDQGNGDRPGQQQLEKGRFQRHPCENLGRNAKAYCQYATDQPDDARSEQGEVFNDYLDQTPWNQSDRSSIEKDSRPVGFWRYK